MTAITAGQCRAARALIGWTRQQLAQRSGVGFSTISDFEVGRHRPHPVNMNAIVGALEAAGVVFDLEAGDGPGVRLKSRQPRDALD
jgi:transcriptional regulator with XRE-family HTH domain